MDSNDKLELNVLAGQLMAIKEGLGTCPSSKIGFVSSVKPVVILHLEYTVFGATTGIRVRVYHRTQSCCMSAEDALRARAAL